MKVSGPISQPLLSLSRRVVLRQLAGIPLAALGPAARAEDPGVGEQDIALGQTVAMSGPLGEFGRDIVMGAKACLERINAAGGINGRKVSLLTLDDRYDVGVATQNISRLLRDDKVFALLSVMGTPISLEAVRQTQAEGVPLFAPWTGVQATRRPTLRHVFNVRASYRDEIVKIITHLRTIGTRRIAIVYFEEAFGTELQTIRDEMARWPAQPVSGNAIRPDGTDVEQVAKLTAQANPEVVVLLTAGKVTVDFIKAYNALTKGTRYYTLSIMGTNASVQALGPHGIGVVVSSVVPFPWSTGVPVVRDYQDAMRRIGAQEFSHISLESYINTRVLAEALRRAGRNLTRARLIGAAETMRPLQLGGFDVSYGPEDHSGSQFVDLNIISQTGRFMK
ncbi:MAG: ABC transporter substrate-binding protein [Lysobacteraceae bacterium]|jgi:ABC-type branched-subunit amino acid transport system substrate-binding protein